MNLYGRLLMLFLKALFSKGKLNLAQPIKTGFRVLPHDLDFNFHMNNGRYLTIMDLARFDFMIQNGLFFSCLRRSWLPVLGETQMVYFRPLKIFESYEIETQLESWDDKWFVISQKFMRHGKVMAHGQIRGLFRGKEGNIKPLQILQLSQDFLSNNQSAPTVQKGTASWIQLIDEIRKSVGEKNKLAK